MPPTPSPTSSPIADPTVPRQLDGSSGDEQVVDTRTAVTLQSATSPPPTGDELQKLVTQAVPDVYRYLLRLTGGDVRLAEDLVQETCLALVRSDHAHDGTLDVGWMVVVARRRFLDHLRRSSREQRHLERAGIDPAQSDPDWSAVDGATALHLLAELPGDQRAALVLRYVDDLPVAEVAALLDRSPAATESLLARARRALAHLVKDASDD